MAGQLVNIGIIEAVGHISCVAVIGRTGNQDSSYAGGTSPYHLSESTASRRDSSDFRKKRQSPQEAPKSARIARKSASSGKNSNAKSVSMLVKSDAYRRDRVAVKN